MTQADPASEPPADPAAMRRLFFRVFPAVGLAMFGAALDQTVVATALPAIARSLGEVERVSWVVVLYLVANTVAAPVYGRLGDAVGRQRMLLVALVVYASGALACALAPSLVWLGVGRFWQGLGGGGLISLCVALIAEVVPARERGRFQGYIAAVFTAASASGPVVGGVLTEQLGWRAVFLLPLPLAALAGFYAVTRLGGAARGNGAALRFDWGGLLLFAAFVGPALLALDQARRLAPGPAMAAAGLGLFAAGALWLLLRWERRAPDPLLPLGVLGDPSIWRANLLSALVSGAFVGGIAFLPIYLAVARGLGPAEAGAALLPLAAGAGLGAMAAGTLMARTGWVMRWAGIGLALATLLMAVTALGATRLPLAALVPLLGLVSAALGASFPMVQVTVQVAAGQERLGSATASVQFTRALGAASGTALLGAVLFGTLAAAGGGTAALFSEVVNQGRGVLAGVPEAMRAAFQAELAAAFRALFGAAALLLAGAAWLTTRVPLRRVG